MTCYNYKHIFSFALLISCSSINIDPVDASITDSQMDVVDSHIANTCNTTNSYPTHISKFECAPNDKSKNYYWRMWYNFIDCHDQLNCPPGSLCLNPYISSGQCGKDALPYCYMLDTKFYCDTISDAGYSGWSQEVIGDCLVNDCPTGAACTIQIYGIGPVFGECGP